MKKKDCTINILVLEYLPIVSRLWGFCLLERIIFLHKIDIIIAKCRRMLYNEGKGSDMYGFVL